MSQELLRHHIEEGTTLGEIVDAHPGVLEVLEEFGIRIDPWTLIALRSSLTELAEYSALRDPRELQDAVEAYLSSNERRAMSPAAAVGARVGLCLRHEGWRAGRIRG